MPEELSQPFADFFDAQSKFKSRLQRVLSKTRQIPAEEAFQNDLLRWNGSGLFLTCSKSMEHRFKHPPVLFHTYLF